jgi:hypothetical protein
MADQQNRTHTVIRECGGIVHSDGNIFFTNRYQFEHAASILLGTATVKLEPSGETMAQREEVCARSCYARKDGMSAIAAELREACETLRWRPIPLNHMIPLMQRAADALDASAAPALEERATDGVKEGVNRG